ncbi:hypothetical protein [Methanobacterium spitsbergense]|uniref:Uncharacterized protein n=1 Tax=Methanobacterium spitsbergense TaxID=2874285 RepID=A0A8T5V0N7_9EURY|nr:hypothetical protein [Methanobacterium spitsbergense]MBZ2167010.1 hypothetical protein [Methanobacterium spitsbergense]
MGKMDKTTLKKIVKKYTDKGDVETAKELLLTWGPRIEDFNIKTELKKLDKIKK